MGISLTKMKLKLKKTPPAAFAAPFLDLPFITPTTPPAVHEMAVRKDIHTLCATYLLITQVHMSYYGKSAYWLFSLSVSFLILVTLPQNLVSTTCWLLFEQGICLLNPPLVCPILATLHLDQATTLKTIFCNTFKAFFLHFHITTKSALPPNQLPIFLKNTLFICLLQLTSLPLSLPLPPPLPFSLFFIALHFSSLMNDTRHHFWWVGSKGTQFCTYSQSHTQCSCPGCCHHGHLQHAPSICFSMHLQLPTSGSWELTLMLLLWFYTLAAPISDLTNQAQPMSEATGDLKESFYPELLPLWKCQYLLFLLD